MSIEANKITIAIFIKLFKIRIVANSRFGFDNNLLINCKFLECPYLENRVFWLREKSATSDPEINADNSKHIIIDIILIKINGSPNNPRLKIYRFKELAF